MEKLVELVMQQTQRQHEEMKEMFERQQQFQRDQHESFGVGA